MGSGAAGVNGLFVISNEARLRNILTSEVGD